MILLQKNFNTRLKVQICGKQRHYNYNNTDRHKQKRINTKNIWSNGLIQQLYQTLMNR